MSKSSKKIGPLDKVHLKLSARLIDQDNTDFPINCEISIIYGIGTAGITPFERILFDKKAGDEITTHLESEQVTEFFGHLLCITKQYLPDAKSYDLAISIQSVETAQGHEVVKSMAQTAGCGTGCECGCGCD